MKVHEASLYGDLQGAILKPAEQTGWGVVVLAGSSGRVDVARARLFAGLGTVCIALRWFGGERQPPGICEVPLEVFTRATDRLIQEGCGRVAYVGTSKGAEAALLIATDDPRIRVVAAISPSPVVWANIGPGVDGVARPQRSSWTRGGVPLPFVRYDETWRPEMREGLVTYRRLYERRLQIGADNLSATTIPVEKAQAGIILVAGGDDALWPSDMFAKSIAERLGSAGKNATLIHHPNAGHRLLFPSETTPRSNQHAHGGSDEADAELGRSAWDAISARLRQ
jgi:dienelactone hydrolase